MNNGEIKSISSSSMAKQVPSLVQSTCPYCGVGCGVDIEMSSTTSQTINSICGSRDHPANYGRLCVKGSHLLETNSQDGRMLSPSMNGTQCDWSQASSFVAKKIKNAILEHGPDSVAFYVSGQLLTEDYYVANKLMKGFIGSANIDTNSRLCMSSAVAAQKRAFGSDSVPCCYEDLEMTDLVLFVGSNAAWTHPVLFQRIERAKAQNPALKTIVIDPRNTASSESADLHLAIKPGTDVALFNGLLRYLNQNNSLDTKFIESHTEDFENALLAAETWTPIKVSQTCEVSAKQVLDLYEAFAQSATTMSFYSMGVNQSSQGVDKANSIINCHLATGKIGVPGSAPFSITGQPNAMGGREVGGLANMLAAHMDLDNPGHQNIVSEFWNTDNLASKPGLKAVDLFDQASKGNIKVLWIMATNPMVSMPNRQKIEQALQCCDTVIVSDCVANNDTLKLADVCLPATSWSEKNGTVTNSERRISRQRGVLNPPGQAKHDWQIMCDVAKELGFKEAFDFEHPSEIFAEHAQLSGIQNNGQRDFDISLYSNISIDEYDKLRPIQWPVTQNAPQGTKRLFTDNQFYTPSKRARFVSTQLVLPEYEQSTHFPFVLNSGRLRDQWHTMTRTGKATELLEHRDTATLDIHPEDATKHGLKQSDLVSLTSVNASNCPVILPINITDEVRQGELFAPIHWSGSWGNASSISALYGDKVDPISGQPELKFTAVKLESMVLGHQCQILTKRSLPDSIFTNYDYWCKSNIFGLNYYLIGNIEIPLSLEDFKSVASAECTVISGSTLKIKESEKSRFQSMLLLDRDRLDSCVYTNLSIEKSNLKGIADLFNQHDLDSRALSLLLRGESTVFESVEFGNQICSCHSVTDLQITQAIIDGACSIEALGKELKCGTNCGSCKPEIQKLINLNPSQDQGHKHSSPNKQSDLIEVALV